MIYGSLSNGLLVIGLSRRNLEQLLQGKPIHKTAQGGLPELMILFGETEDGIMKQLAEAGVDTGLYDQQAANKEPV